MNKRIVSALALSLLLFRGSHLYSAETNAPDVSALPAETKAATNTLHADLVNLVSRVNVKFNQDKTNESDYAPELKGFDEIIARNKDSDLNDLASVLRMKAGLYIEVLHEPAKALPVLKQFDVLLSQHTNATLQNLAAVLQIKAILTIESSNDAEMTRAVLKQFDTLLSQHKDADPEDLAGILGMTGELYMKLLNDPEGTLIAFKQIQKDYPNTQVAKNVAENISSLEQSVAKKKINDALVAGAQFPDFNETDIAGKPLSISKYKGKVVLVDFWATWCPPCVAEMPRIIEAYNKYHDKGFEVVGISLDEDKDKLDLFIKQRKMPWPQFFDGKRWDNVLAAKYGVLQAPTTFLLDRDGKIIKKLTQADDIVEEIATALKK